MIIGRSDENTYVDVLDTLEPVVCVQETEYGWRGLTSDGEVYEVSGVNGHRIAIPSEITVFQNGRPFGKRAVTNEWTVDIDDYLVHFNAAVELYKSNNAIEALEECELALRIAPTRRLQFNRSMILLALGRWREGLKAYWICEQSKPFMRPQVTAALAAGLRPWTGEPTAHKRMLLLHAHGFGDTIMMLRYVPPDATMVMPAEMHRLAEQFGRVTDRLIDCDFFCPILHLLYHLDVVPGGVHTHGYIKTDRYDVEIKRWQHVLGPKTRKRIGLAWSIGKPSTGDYPRPIDLADLVEQLGGDDAELHSVQIQDREDAVSCGVTPHKFIDFADCAAFMTCMDEIISVDTAALHLAGAIAHPNVTGLLSYWHSWRWTANWYRTVKLVCQATPDSWAGVL